MTPSQRAAALRLADSLSSGIYAEPHILNAAALLRELAAEPVQEPVCWGWRVPDGRITAIFSERKDNPDVEVVALYAAPQQRKPLSDQQIGILWKKWVGAGRANFSFARAVEKAHGITGEPT